MSYQSPISLHSCHSLPTPYSLLVTGINKGATYDDQHHVFWVNDPVFLTHQHRLYRWVEYHFHIPSEHKLHGDEYEAEIHYVFVLIHSKDDIPRSIHVCDGDTKNESILVLGRVIRDKALHQNLAYVQVQLPRDYFEYDGTLTTGNLAPVRWVVGSRSLAMNRNEIATVAKHQRPLQPLNDRIVLQTRERPFDPE